MAPYQKRVVKEKEDLDEKIEALTAYIGANGTAEGQFASLHGGERERLVRQLSCMREYSEILGERITAFGAVPAQGD